MTSPARSARILLVDDEPSLREVIAIAFRRAGYEAMTAQGASAAIGAVTRSPQPFTLVITDLAMPDGSGLDVLEAAKKRSAATEVIVITAYSTVESAIDAMKRGAYDFVKKPFSPAELVALAEKALEKNAIVEENRRLKAHLERIEPHERDIFGTSPAMRGVAELVDKIASTRTTVLITGESGTGKEVVARAIHDRSDRAKNPFLVVNCGALPEALMESELFGHEKGAFTGAASRSEGLFRHANGGTLLLDEVGELPAALQVKLLRVLQEKRVRAVGGTTEEPVDVRLIAATNRDVEADVASGKFRQDLYYRLNVIRIPLPPLRERAGDIARLAERFLRGFASELGKDVRTFTPDALRAIEAHPFPGNVRELENVIERAIALASGPSIGLGDLPPTVSGLSGRAAPMFAELPPEGCALDDVLSEVERRLIVQALDRSGGIRTSAAKILGVTFRSLRYRLAKHALVAEDETSEDRPSMPMPDPQDFSPNGPER